MNLINLRDLLRPGFASEHSVGIIERIRAYLHILDRTEFPCYFAANALERGKLYGLLSPSEADFSCESLRSRICEFLHHENDPLSLPALLVFMDRGLTSLSECRDLFWHLISEMNTPEGRASGTLIIDNVKVFVNGHSRHYMHKRSRWTPFDLMIVVQAYDNLNHLAVCPEKTAKISNSIRAKVLAYDGCPVGPQFGDHFADPSVLDFDQFWISDEPNTKP